MLQLDFSIVNVALPTIQRDLGMAPAQGPARNRALAIWQACKHYPCIKRAGVEYLGEHPEPELDRVE